MKKRSIVSLLLALALVLSYMPALAFADDGSGTADISVSQVHARAAEVKAKEKAAEAKAEASATGQAKKRVMAGESESAGNNKVPKSIEYVGDNEYMPAKYSDDGEAWFNGFGTIGNKITITYEDGTSETFECKRFEFPSEDGGTDWSWAYVPANEDPIKAQDPEDGYYYAKNEVGFDVRVNDQTNKITITKEVEVYDAATGEYGYPSVSTTIQGKYMTELKYTGVELTYDPWDDPKYTNIYQDGSEFTVVYSDGSELKLVCKAFAERADGDDTWYDYAFFANDEEIIMGKDGDGEPTALNGKWMDSDDDKYDAAKGVYAGYYYVSCYVPVKEKQYVTPVSAELALADGYVAQGLAGEKWVSGWQLCAPGNKVIIHYSDNTSKEFAYAEKGKEEGFYCGDEQYYPYISLTKRIKKGTATYSGKLEVEGPGYQWYYLPVSVKVKASKNYVYVESKDYSYTGKKIAPTVVVKYWTGSKFKTMPKSWYTCKPAKKKNIGWYEFKVTLKKKYRKKYENPVWGVWHIVPKTPVIKSVTKKGHDMTVTWTKFTAAQRKTITGFYIEVSTNKSFKKDVMWFRVNNKAASKHTLEGFDSGKYYVRVRSFTEKNDNYYFESKPSKAKAVTIS